MRHCTLRVAALQVVKVLVLGCSGSYWARDHGNGKLKVGVDSKPSGSGTEVQDSAHSGEQGLVRFEELDSARFEALGSEPSSIPGWDLIGAVEVALFALVYCCFCSCPLLDFWQRLVVQVVQL